MDETRNVLVESARIARGQIKNISQLDADNYDAVIFPGGLGVAKNLSNFTTENENFTVDETIVNVLKQFHEQKKPLGFVSISPILAAKVFGKKSGGKGCSITLGKQEKEWPHSFAIGIIN